VGSIRSSRGGPREIKASEPVGFDAPGDDAVERRRRVRAERPQVDDVDLARALVAVEVVLGDPAVGVGEGEEEHRRPRHRDQHLR
jgi:hypothetical protein